MSRDLQTTHTRRGGRDSAFRPIALALLGVWTLTAAATAQQASYPIYTQDDFVKTMKSVGQNFGAINTAIAANDFEEAKGRVVRSREQLATTVTFWRKNKKEDAIKMWRAAIAKMDELDTALSAEKRRQGCGLCTREAGGRDLQRLPRPIPRAGSDDEGLPIEARFGAIAPTPGLARQTFRQTLRFSSLPLLSPNLSTFTPRRSSSVT